MYGSLRKLTFCDKWIMTTKKEELKPEKGKSIYLLGKLCEVFKILKAPIKVWL